MKSGKIMAGDEVMLSRLNELASQVRGEVDQTQGVDLSPQDEDGFKTSPARRTRLYYHRDQPARPQRPVNGNLPPSNKAQRGELRMCVFVKQEAARMGLSYSAVSQRLLAGRYPGVTLRKVNVRTVFVKVKSRAVESVSSPRPGEIAMKEFVMAEATRFGVTLPAIYNRIRRGGYPHLNPRVVSKRLIFVQASPEQAVGT